MLSSNTQKYLSPTKQYLFQDYQSWLLQAASQQEIKVYTDYSYNGKDEGGIGILYCFTSFEIIQQFSFASKSLFPVDDGQVQAITLVSDIQKLCPWLQKIHIYTDSSNALKIVRESYIFQKNKRGEQIISLEKIKAHSGIYGNEKADELAFQARFAKKIHQPIFQLNTRKQLKLL